jgi:hypothetical protein
MNVHLVHVDGYFTWRKFRGIFFFKKMSRNFELDELESHRITAHNMIQMFSPAVIYSDAFPEMRGNDAYLLSLEMIVKIDRSFVLRLLTYPSVK